MHKEVVVSVRGGAQDSPGHSPEQPDLTRPALGRGWTKQHQRPLLTFILCFSLGARLV